jgi:hypothetical protein
MAVRPATRMGRTSTLLVLKYAVIVSRISTMMMVRRIAWRIWRRVPVRSPGPKRARN